MINDVDTYLILLLKTLLNLSNFLDLSIWIVEKNLAFDIYYKLII